jgi:DNA polymerase III subunit delta'
LTVEAAFQGILGQDALLSALGRAMREERLASALLFHGPAGVGKLTTALSLFRALLCPVSSPAPCGRCDSCRRLGGRLLHPDVGLLWPQSRASEGAEEEGDEEEVPGNLREGGIDLHSLQDDIRRNTPWKILADRSRDRLRELFLSPGSGRRRVLLVLASERLGGVSGNILLKVLEEPPGGAVIVLLCENPSALLPTLRSRCQSCRFAPLSRDAVEAFLLSRGGSPPGEARRIAALAGGRIGAALDLAREAGGYESRRSLLAALLATLRKEPSPAVALAAARELTQGEAGTVEDLAVLMDILRDAMLSAAGCAASMLTDTRAAGPPLNVSIPAQEAAWLLPRVERAREDLRRNINRQVALEGLFLDLARPDLSAEDLG